jgi:hypothetical protein
MHTREFNIDQLGKFGQPVAHAAPYAIGVGSIDPYQTIVLPEQLCGPPRCAAHTQGEIALRSAVLNDALGCFLKQFVKDGQRTRRLAKEAEEWLFDDDDRWPFSFVNICHALGIEPARLRRDLKQLVPAPAGYAQKAATPRTKTPSDDRRMSCLKGEGLHWLREGL